MNQQDIITANYGDQTDLIIQSLSAEALATISNLCLAGHKRVMTDATIKQLAQFAPHRQQGFIANPLLEFCIGRIGVSQQTAQTAPSVPTNKQPTPEPKPQPKPEPEPDPEPETEIENLFDIF